MALGEADGLRRAAAASAAASLWISDLLHFQTAWAWFDLTVQITLVSMDYGHMRVQMPRTALPAFQANLPPLRLCCGLTRCGTGILLTMMSFSVLRRRDLTGQHFGFSRGLIFKAVAHRLT